VRLLLRLSGLLPAPLRSSPTRCGYSHLWGVGGGWHKKNRATQNLTNGNSSASVSCVFAICKKHFSQNNAIYKKHFYIFAVRNINNK
jgi:hypothetical protein